MLNTAAKFRLALRSEALWKLKESFDYAMQYDDNAVFVSRHSEWMKKSMYTAVTAAFRRAQPLECVECLGPDSAQLQRESTKILL